MTDRAKLPAYNNHKMTVNPQIDEYFHILHDKKETAEAIIFLQTRKAQPRRVTTTKCQPTSPHHDHGPGNDTNQLQPTTNQEQHINDHHSTSTTTIGKLTTPTLPKPLMARATPPLGLTESPMRHGGYQETLHTQR